MTVVVNGNTLRGAYRQLGRRLRGQAVWQGVPLDFARRYCQEAIPLPVAQFHFEICGSYEKLGQGLRHAEAYPRGHGKTTWWSRIGPLWAVAMRRRRYVLLLSSSLSISAGNLVWVRRKLEFDLRQDFGDLVGPKWTASCLETSTGIRIEARGTGADLRGLISGESRPDLIICDDLEGRENVATYEQRQKLESWFDTEVMGLLGPGGADIFLVGTILHHDSLLARKIAKWKGRTGRAIIDHERREVLAPGLFDYDKLLRIRDGDGIQEGIGTLAFEQEYQNNPIDLASQRIKAEWIRYFTEEDLGGRELQVAIALDPAVGKGSGGDYAGLVALGKDLKTGKDYFVLEAKLFRATPQAQVQELILMAQRWEKHNGLYGSTEKHGEVKQESTTSGTVRVVLKGLYVEDVAFQSVLADLVKVKVRDMGLHYRVEGIKNIKDKEARIDTLSAPIELGAIKFRVDQHLLLDQLLTFPRGAHDDGPDALEMAYRVLKSSGEPKVRWL